MRHVTLNSERYTNNRRGSVSALALKKTARNLGKFSKLFLTARKGEGGKRKEAIIIIRVLFQALEKRAQEERARDEEIRARSRPAPPRTFSPVRKDSCHTS